MGGCMAYLILNVNNPTDGSVQENYYEFDAHDRDVVEMIEELLTQRKECPLCAREKMDLLFDAAVQKKQKSTIEKIVPTSMKKKPFFPFQGKSTGVTGETMPTRIG
jgi:hypothetical protein